MKNDYIKNLSDTFAQAINNSICLELSKHTDPIGYYTKKISINEAKIQELKSCIDEFMKIPINERLHESIYGDARLITYQESIDKDKNQIKKLQKENERYKNKLNRL